MDISKIILILNKADPLNNSNYQERQVALNMAHKAMDSQHLSYASLGYSQTDAERIENQFSVSTGHESSGNSRTGYQWWNPFSWGTGQTRAAKQERAHEQPIEQNGNAYDSSSDYKSYNDPTSPDYQYQVNYDESNNGYWDGAS